MMSKTKSRLFLLLIFAACAAPVVASLLLYYVWRPAKFMNYGELVENRSIPADALKGADGKPLALVSEHTWTLLQIDSGACDKACAQRLYDLRQIWLAMGVNKDRLQRVWALTDDVVPSAALLQEHPGLQIARAQASLESTLTGPAATRIYLIDPRGKQVLRYPSEPEPKRMIKDIARLLVIKRM